MQFAANMLTMAGNRGPMMVALPGLSQANTVPPRLTEEEERRRQAMLHSVREFNPKQELKHCQTDDKSGPVADGEKFKLCQSFTRRGKIEYS